MRNKFSGMEHTRTCLYGVRKPSRHGQALNYSICSYLLYLIFSYNLPEIRESMRDWGWGTLGDNEVLHWTILQARNIRGSMRDWAEAEGPWATMRFSTGPFSRLDIRGSMRDWGRGTLGNNEVLHWTILQARNKREHEGLRLRDPGQQWGSSLDHSPS